MDAAKITALATILSVLISATVAFVVATIQSANARKLESIKVANEFRREKRAEIFSLRNYVREHAKDWSWAYNPNYDWDMPDDADRLLELSDDLPNLMETLREAQPYLTRDLFEKIEPLIDACEQALDSCNRHWTEDREDYEADGHFLHAENFRVANGHLVKVTEGVLLIEIEHLFAAFEDRPPNLKYCQRVMSKYFQDS